MGENAPNIFIVYMFSENRITDDKEILFVNRMLSEYSMCTHIKLIYVQNR